MKCPACNWRLNGTECVNGGCPSRDHETRSPRATHQEIAVKKSSKKRKDAAERIAMWLDVLNNDMYEKTKERPFWLPLPVHESLKRRIRAAIRAAVLADRKARAKPKPIGTTLRARGGKRRGR